MFKGIAASSGVSICKALVLKEVKYNIEKKNIEDVPKEIDSLHAALKLSREQLSNVKKITENKMGKDNAEIFEAHLLMLDDPE